MLPPLLAPRRATFKRPSSRKVEVLILKVYIVCDLEGTAGVVDFEKQCMEDGPYYRQAVTMATRELNALMEGVIEGGATEVYAWPGHGDFPGGIDIELIHPECRLVMHAGDGGPEAFDGSFDARLLLGLHARAGAEDGVLSHSFTPLIRSFNLNGVEMGEIGLNIAASGEAGVPTVFVSGDKAATDEARALVPGIEAATVKWGLGEKRKLGALSVRKAVSLAPEKAQRLIRETGIKAMARVDEIEPYRLEPPYALRVEYTAAKYAANVLSAPGVERAGETVTLQTRERLSDLVF